MRAVRFDSYKQQVAKKQAPLDTLRSRSIVSDPRSNKLLNDYKSGLVGRDDSLGYPQKVLINFPTTERS